MSETVWEIAELTLAVIREADLAKKKDLQDRLIALQARSVFEMQRELEKMGASFA